MDNDGASNLPTDGQNLYRPETVITPGAANPVPQQLPPEEPTTEEKSPENQVSAQYAVPDQDYPSSISWTASEFIAHQKSAGWFGLLAIAALVLAVLVWLVTRDVIATSTVIVGVLLLGVYAVQSPRQTSYTLDEFGLMIGSRQYRYDDFRSFTIVPEGAFLSVELMPLKRMAMMVTMYLDPEDEDRILDMLSLHLPLEETRTNLTDSLMRRIRF